MFDLIHIIFYVLMVPLGAAIIYAFVPISRSGFTHYRADDDELNEE